MEPQTVQPDFTVICVSHRPEILARFLLPSLRSQQPPPEIRILDQREKAFTSCAAALNAGATFAHGRYLLFVHHDVAWKEPDFLARFAAILDKLPHLGVAGPIGMSLEGRTQRERTRGAILAGESGTALDGQPLLAPAEVQTLDEMMLAVPADVFSQLAFDETTCDSWHLYGVDYALSVQRLGLKAYAVQLPVRHGSAGKVDASYFRTLGRLVEKHRKGHRWIYTMCDPWRTRGPDWLNPMLFRARYCWDSLKGRLLRQWLSLHHSMVQIPERTAYPRRRLTDLLRRRANRLKK